LNQKGNKTFLFSFWKVDPIPNKNKIEPVEWKPLGEFDEVVNRVLDIKNTSIIVDPLNSVLVQPNHMLKVKWDIGRGAYLTIKSETKKPDRGDVMMLGGVSFVNDWMFYKLFTQLYEQFDVVLFDEQVYEFVNIKDFKKNRLDI